ncbi:phosphoribosylanthranilate isomerase [Anaeromyxobacter oryzae]|uniref:N-(5'-phosphoribosyl)anthranilate isomerase n=1 Tax=Anaeromyxobacter oryzae TaxID=2918170 RepID=A0ABM7WWR2_9BACT|nr:phosphoribosylanthranilate isomerase [Anaeromyxobacter oryzae]BDG03957.1 N-(5'-phosphoribosyl)anthranilate isomerase [Anaeromyxobacter oryzae]
MAVLIKICGFTRLEDALDAVALGADALGFNFWPRSKRYIAPVAARAIIDRLPPGTRTFGVFVNPTREELLAAIAASGVGTVQLHGDEPPALCQGLPVPVVKAIRVRDAHSLAALASYEVSGFLLDSSTAGYGGSGAAFDWSLAAEAAADLPVWLAGGLTPENVADAIQLVRPLGVDVASGVESSPGVKDYDKMKRFIEAARGAKT